MPSPSKREPYMYCNYCCKPIYMGDTVMRVIVGPAGSKVTYSKLMLCGACGHKILHPRAEEEIVNIWKKVQR